MTNADNYQLESSRWSAGRNALALAAIISVVACVAGYIQDPTRFARSYMVAFSFTAAIGLGAFFFVMVQYLTGSAWSVTIRRIMENIMITLPVGALLFIPIAFGLKDIYPWMNTALVNADPVLRGKAGYLNEGAFLIRAYVFFALWSIWIFAILLPIDEAGRPAVRPSDAYYFAMERAGIVPRHCRRNGRGL